MAPSPESLGAGDDPGQQPDDEPDEERIHVRRR